MLHIEISLETRLILAKNIEDFIVSKNLTMEQLGELCGSTKQYIHKLKNGEAKANPSLDFLDKLASAMNCKVSDLFTEDKFKTKKSHKNTK